MRSAEYLAFAVALLLALTATVMVAASVDADVRLEVSVVLDDDQDELTYTVTTDASSVYVQIRNADTGEIEIHGQNPDVHEGECTRSLDVSGLSNGTYVLWVQAYEGTGYYTAVEFTIDARDVPVTGVSIADTESYMTIGTTATIHATITPEDATNRNVTWESDNPGVVSVDEEGNVTAHTTGVATITVTTEDGGYTDSIKITVIEGTVSVTGVSLSQTSIALVVGGSSTLTAILEPNTATNQNVTWESSDTSVATVANGVVQAVSAGTATVTVTTEDGGYTATCQVTVNAPVASGIYLSPTSLSLEVGEAGTISVTVSGYGYGDLVMTNSSSAVASAEYDQSSGTVTVEALAEGTATITVYLRSDATVSASATVTVTEPDEEPVERTYNFFIKMNKDAELVDPADSGGRSVAQLEAGFTISGTGTNAADALEDACSNEGLECNLWWGESGGQDLRGWIVTLMGMAQYQTGSDWTYWIQYHDGTYNQYTLGYYTDGGDFSLIWDTTSADVEGVVSLDRTSLTLTVGQTAALTATVYPEDATLTWTSSDTAVATVSDGLVAAVSAGTAVITVSASNGLSATCRVTVTESSGSVTEPTGVSLNRTSVVLATDSSTQLRATLTPSGATATLTWTSSDTTVATVDGDGVVYGVSAGTATITVTTSNGLSATCEVTVRDGNTTESSETVNNEDGTSTVTDSTRTEFDDGSSLTTTVETVTSSPDGEGDVISVTTTVETVEADGSSETVVTVEASTEAGDLFAETITTVTSDGETSSSAVVTIDDGDVGTSASMASSPDGTVESSVEVTVRAETGVEDGASSAAVDGDAIARAAAQIAEAAGYVGDAEVAITVIAVSGQDPTSAEVAFDDGAMEALASTGASLTVVTDLGTVDVAPETVSAVGEGVRLIITIVDEEDLGEDLTEVVGDGAVFDVSLIASDGQIRELGADMTIRLRYVLGEGESPDDVRVYHIDDEGNVEEVDSEYDEVGQFAVFTTDHLSVYAVTASSPGDSGDSDDSGNTALWAAAAMIIVVVVAVAAVVWYTRR